jgi:multidrug efflux pump subunit AcrB
MEHGRAEKMQGKGPIAWMAGNSVAANLLMACLLIGGVVMTGEVKQEVFPAVDLDIISIAVPYPGASPDEVEQGIVMVVEEQVRGLDGIKEVNSTAFEGAGNITVELIDGTNPNKALGDIKTAVDRIVSFPEDAEEPTTSLLLARNKVLSLVIFGDHDEETLRGLVDHARDELIKDPDITQTDLTGIRAREIAVEIPQRALRAHHLTLSDVAQSVRMASVDLPAGSVKAAGGETLLRTKERREYGAQFVDIALRRSNTGAQLTLGMLGEVLDGFSEADLITTYNGKSAVQVDVYRVGKQTPIEVSAAVHKYLLRLQAELPEGVEADVWRDRSIIYAERVDLLMRNAKLGLVLVFLALAFFLEVKLAFWVVLGIPISFLGAFLLMPAMDVSVNMISLFAFIVTLGVVVDDAIVVGENIHELKTKGIPGPAAAVAGAKQVGMPVVFAVLTTVTAFAPLFFVPGVSGKFFRVIPAIVVAVILISLVESLFILPAHLAHSKPTTNRFVLILLSPFEVARRFSTAALAFLIERTYEPSVRFASRNRYLTLAVALATLAGSVGLLGGGHLEFTFMPKLEGDTVKAMARLPVGAPMADAIALRDRLMKTADEVIAEAGAEVSEGIYASIGQTVEGGGGPMRAVTAAGGTHIVEIAIRLVESGKRTVSSPEIANRWRVKNTDIPGLRSLIFSGDLGSGGGKPIDVLLSHNDTQVLETAAATLAQELAAYNGTADLDDGVAGGKTQLDIKLKPAAKALGLTEALLARQVRDAFFGAEALRQQRGRDEVRVMVRLPKVDRDSMASFENLMLRAPNGAEIPLSEAATLQMGRAYTEIQREDGRRVIHVTGDVDASGNADKILAQVKDEVMPKLVAATPGLTWSFEGANRDRAESFGALKTGFMLALLVIYGLLAVPFRSYVQPLIIMSAIPFGIVGAIIGHILLGYDLSFISVMGIVALAGIVVNDSLIMVVAINELREHNGLSAYEAVVRGAMRRFRPIILTSLTTFFGLVPMIFETSVQARFLIPMAISLGFGVLFATVLILVVVPSLYLIVEDLRWLVGVGEFPHSRAQVQLASEPEPELG